MREKKRRAINYYKESVKVSNGFLILGFCIILAGFLMMWWSEKQVYQSFALGLFVSTPLFILKAIIDRNSYTKKKKQLTDLPNNKLWFDGERQYIEQTTFDNQKHKKICIFLIGILIILGISSCWTSYCKSIWVSVASMFLIISLEYINNIIEDYRLYEYKYRLEREEHEDLPNIKNHHK